MRRTSNERPGSSRPGGGTLTTREATREDAAAIAALTTELGYPVTAEEAAARLDALQGRTDQRTLVAIEDGRVVGWIQAHASVVLESGFRVEIVGLILAEDCRRRGVGRALTREVEDWAVQIGACALVVRTHVTREAAARFYSGLGFSVAKTQTVFRKRLEQGPTPASA